MDIDKVSELARTIAALPQAERDAFDGLLADVRKKDAEARRVAKLRAMPNPEIFGFILRDARRGPKIQDLDEFAVARDLVAAGFMRVSGPAPDLHSVELTLRGQPFLGVREENCACTIMGTREELNRLVGALKANRRLVGCFEAA